MRIVLLCAVLLLVCSCTSAPTGRLQAGPGGQPKGKDAIGFEVFASFGSRDTIRNYSVSCKHEA